MSVEISHSAWQPLDRRSLVACVLRDLARLGLLRAPDDVVVQHLLELRYGYPIYDRHYAWATALIRRYLSEQGIHLIGRFGSWRYLSMEATLLESRRAAATVTCGTSWP